MHVRTYVCRFLYILHICNHFFRVFTYSERERVMVKLRTCLHLKMYVHTYIQYVRLYIRIYIYVYVLIFYESTYVLA